MTDSHPRERFIPLRKTDLVSACAEDLFDSDPARGAFLDFCRILASTFHFEFHERLESLKDGYAPFDPDADTVLSAQKMERETEKRKRFESVVSGLRGILEAANFVPISEEELQDALEKDSLFRIKLHVDFDDFEDLLLFRRGARAATETVHRWWGLKKDKIEFVTYERVALMVRFKDAAWFEGQERSGLPFEPGKAIVKLFRNVPRHDIEMLFPNTEVGMRMIDKVVLGVPAVAGGLAVVVTKLGATLILLAALVLIWLGIPVQEKQPELQQRHLVALMVGLATLGAYVWRQWNRFKSRKIEFMKALTENLYFKVLDNNAGVFHRIVDDAEEEEVKEAVLAYAFLLQAEERGMTQAELDGAIESWIGRRWQREVDFEIDDGLGKLDRLGLLLRDDDRLRVRPLDEAKRVLDSAWDGFFQYSASPAT